MPPTPWGAPPAAPPNKPPVPVAPPVDPRYNQGPRYNTPGATYAPGTPPYMLPGWNGGMGGNPFGGGTPYAPPALPQGGGYGAPAAPAWEPPPKPNPTAYWLPDGDGIHGHWVNNDTPNGGPDPAWPVPPVPPVDTPGAVPGAPPSFAPSYYAPSVPSPYLTLPSNWLSNIDPTMRAQLNQQLQGLGFNPTGSVGQYGEQLYMAPPQFNNENLSALSDPGLRQWIKFFLGGLGYGISYNLPSTYTGQGMPPAPPMPPVAPPNAY